MKLKESAVHVTLNIDRDRLDRVAALAKVKAVSVKNLLRFFLAARLNHPKG